MTRCFPCVETVCSIGAPVVAKTKDSIKLRQHLLLFDQFFKFDIFF